jgi:hypothetical protein
MNDWVPILGVSIPLVAVLGRTVVQPILQFIERRRGIGSDLEVLRERIALLEQSLEGVEGSLGRLEEEREFLRQLQAPPR